MAQTEVLLPNWVVEALTRVTSRGDLEQALALLDNAAAALLEGRFGDALELARLAKGRSPRDATIREVLGIAAYRLGEWEEALRELRTFRRLAGDDTHLPVEMDILRALGRSDAVEKTWQEVAGRVTDEDVVAEATVVYVSHLLDEGETARALQTVENVRVRPEPAPWDLRLWFVAARTALAGGDVPSARRWRDAILAEDPGMPGLDELDAAIGSD